MFGKTNTPEFGVKNITEPEANGPTRNPWNPAHTPPAVRRVARQRRSLRVWCPLPVRTTAAAPSGSPPPAADSSG